MGDENRNGILTAIFLGAALSWAAVLIICAALG